MRLIAPLLLLLLMFAGTASTTGNATGRVYDYYTGVGLDGASVNLTNHTAETYTANATTNATGYYTIAGLPADNYNIKVNAASSRYVPRSGYFAVTDSATTTCNVYMYANPSISQSINFDVSEEVKKNTSIRLWWTSDLPTKGYIEYGTTTSYGSETPDDDYSYVHFVEITGLAEETLQHYRIVSTDLHGTNYNSDDYNFTTLSTTALDNLVKAARNDGALPKTYYVRTDGNDSNTGLTNDAGGAWLTIDYAVDTIDVGDTILVQSGTYYESVTISEFQGDYGHGIPTHHIRLVADGDVTIDGNYIDSRAFTISSATATQGYVDVVGFKCYNHTGYSIYSGGAQGITLEDNIIKNSDFGIWLRDTADIEYSHVLNNTFENMSSGGIESMGSKYVRIKDNSLDDFSGYAISTAGERILVEDNVLNHSAYGINMVDISFATIRDNAVTNITDRSIRIGAGHTYAVLVHNNTITAPVGANYLITVYPNVMTTITENTFRVGSVSVKGDFSYIYNNSLDGLGVSGGSESATAEVYCEKSVVENNVFVAGGGISVSRQLDCTIKNNIVGKIDTNHFLDHSVDTKIVNNVIYNTTNGVLIDVADENMVIKNNVFYNISGYCVDNQEGTNITVSYNCVHLNETTAYNNTTDAGNMVYQDPLFADVSGGDFHLKSEHGRWTGSAWVADAASSPCIDTGDPSDSYTNEPAPNGSRINIGAYGNTDEASKSSTPSWSPSDTAMYYNTTSQITITTKTDGTNVFSRTPTQADGNATSGRLVVKTT